MRGEYKFHNQDRIAFWLACHDLCKSDEGRVELASTCLNLCNCEDALEELGYEREYNETNGWDMDFWWTFTAAGLPDIVVSGCGYTADLAIHFKGIDDGEEIDKAAFIERIQNKWGKYFPVW